jgi:hypothetical protein
MATARYEPMVDQLLTAKLYGYYVPDVEYVFRAPDVCTALWGPEAWKLHVKPVALETH